MTFSRRLRAKTHGSSCIGNLAQVAGWLDGSRVRRESHARFWERPRVKAPRPTRPTVPVLAKGKTDTGRLWIYVRDDEPFGGAGPRPRSSTTRATGAASIRRRQAWLADVLSRIAGHPAHRLDELLPWNWRPQPRAVAALAA